MPARISPLMTPYSSSSRTSARIGARLLDDVVQRVQRPALAHADRRPRARRAGRRRARRPATGASTVARPAASSWRMTRSGRNSSRCRRRIVRRRCTSDGV